MFHVFLKELQIHFTATEWLIQLPLKSIIVFLHTNLLYVGNVSIYSWII